MLHITKRRFNVSCSTSQPFKLIQMHNSGTVFCFSNIKAGTCTSCTSLHAEMTVAGKQLKFFGWLLPSVAARGCQGDSQPSLPVAGTGS